MKSSNIALIIIEEYRRLHNLLPVYEGKIVGCVDQMQRETYMELKRDVEENIKKLQPYYELAEKEKEE